MIGQKYIPQTIAGEQAAKIAKTLPKKDCNIQPKGRAPLPDKFSTRLK